MGCSYSAVTAFEKWTRGGVPGRIRTCDLPLRRRLLCPLSYGDAVSCLVLARICAVDASLAGR
jgi:hypothetical protein